VSPNNNFSYLLYTFINILFIKLKLDGVRANLPYTHTTQAVQGPANDSRPCLPLVSKLVNQSSMR